MVSSLEGREGLDSPMLGLLYIIYILRRYKLITHNKYEIIN